ncbi:MAG: minor capsid protein [Clostridia bacterium]|nr:minor capsid protein [Clostridia bacterium]
MTNSEYWRKRMDAQAGSVYKRCDQFIAELMRQYQTAVRSMEADIAKWYQRFANANGITLAEAGRLLNSDELLEFQWTVEDYIRRGEENAVSGVWMKELESASARVHISRLDSLKMSLRQHVEELIGMQLTMLPEVLHATYRESYDRTVYELSWGSRVMLSYQKPDVRRIDRVLGTPWSSDGKEFSERVWNNRAQLIGSMNTHLTQSIIRGEDPQKAINAIAKDMDVSKRRAGTLVMTESAAIATAAQRDCYKDLDVEEFEYVCTLDEVTCPVCGAMDGKHFPMSKYEIGVNVPPMHPNCRCATAPYFDDMDDWGAERAARDENGKTVSVPAEMTYEQWKQAQDAKFGEGYIDKQRKKAYNEAADKEQFEQYKSRLGDDAPKSFLEFQNLKYDDPEKYAELTEFYSYKGRVPEATKQDFSAYKALKELGVVGTIRVPPLPIDADTLGFKDAHGSRHGCSIEDARAFVRDAKCSIRRQRWNGFHINYYSLNGATYISEDGNVINTAFAEKDFDENTRKMLEVFR